MYQQRCLIRLTPVIKTTEERKSKLPLRLVDAGQCLLVHCVSFIRRGTYEREIYFLRGYKQGDKRHKLTNKWRQNVQRPSNIMAI